MIYLTYICIFMAGPMFDRYETIRDEINLKKPRMAASQGAPANPHFRTVSTEQFHKYAEGDHATTRFTLGFIVFKRDIDVSDSDFQNMAVVRIAFAKASGHLGDALKNLPPDRYAFRIPGVLISSLYVNVHHASSIFNVESIFRGDTPGTGTRERNCVGCSRRSMFWAYGT